MLTLHALTSLLVAVAPWSPQTQGTPTIEHDHQVRIARPGDEGLLRFTAPDTTGWHPSAALPSNQASGSGSLPPGLTQAISYDVETGIESLIDVEDSLDLARWIPGSAPTKEEDEESESWSSDLSAITSQSFPWSAQVRVAGVDASGNPFDVSGTLIDARHVITAGHCVHGGAGGTWHSSIYVYPAWDGDSDAYGSAWASAYATFNGWINSSNPADDVGFLRLDRPLGFLTGWLGHGFDTNDSFYSSNYFNVAGYPDSSSCYSGAPDQLFYGFGLYDSVSSGLLHADASWSCGGQGMDGAGAYVILSSERYVYATHRLHDTTARYDIEHTRLSSGHVDFYDNTVRPGGYSSSDPDYVPLDVQVDTGGSYMLAGDPLVSMDYLVGNASLFDPVGTQTHAVDVYLSTNNNISTFDTLIQTHTYDYDYEAVGYQRVSVTEPPVIPADTPSGIYWIGVITRSYDANSSNNDTDGRDAFQIEVRGARIRFTPFGVGLPGSGGFAPLLYGLGDSGMAGGHSIDLAGALGGADGTLWIGFNAVDIPLWGGHFYVGLSPSFVAFNFRARGATDVPGVGTFSFPGGDVREFGGLELFMQITLRDPGAVRGISLTNGLTMEILP